MATRRRGGRAPDTAAQTIPAPVGGLNDRDPIANMPGMDAIILDNWWPEPGQLTVRKGSTLHAENLGAPVETIVEYCPPDGNVQLLAAAGGSIYDVTFLTDDPPELTSGHTSAKWQVAQTTTPGGSFMLWLNGVDKPLLYDGTNWTQIDDTSSPAIEGVDSTRLLDAVVFKNRVYLVERDSLNLWYLPVLSIAGEADYIPLGQVFRRGGHIVTAQTWTIDAGEGADDMLVVLSSNGEVAVYKGYDPTDASTWSLVGVFYIGRPVGQRPCIKFGGDLLIICEDGVFPLSTALMSNSVNAMVAITDKIQNSIKQAVASQKSAFGWQICLSPGNTALILNVPRYEAPPIQYVQNTLTGAWARFSGWNALSWIDSQLGLFYGDSEGNIVRAWTGNQDQGENIRADVLQAFSSFGSNSVEKYFTMIRPYIESSGSPAIMYELCGDFVVSEPVGELNYTPPTGMIWGSMVWGSMVWGGSKTQIYDWRTVGRVAKSGAVRMLVQNNGSEVSWSATDVKFTLGWFL